MAIVMVDTKIVLKSVFLNFVVVEDIVVTLEVKVYKSYSLKKERLHLI